MKKLRELSELRAGHTIRREDKMLGGEPVSAIQINNILSDYSVDMEALTDMELKRVPESAYLRKGDVLFSARGRSNRAGVYMGTDNHVIASGQLLVVSLTTDQVSPEFLAWYISQGDAQRYFENHRTGSHIQIISKSVLAELPIAIPPRIIQDRIVELDRLIRDEQDLLSKLADRRFKLLNGLCLEAARKHGKLRGGDNA